MGYILGVDSGATKTIVQIANTSGEVLSESKHNSCNFKSVGIQTAKENIGRAVLKAIRNIKHPKKFTFKYACFGLAGNDSVADNDTYWKIIFESRIKRYLDPYHTLICNDTRIGIAAGSDNKNSIIIICGTGSNCLGINDNGKEVKVNGWDYILGDEGSGYEIGLKALKAVMKAYDGRGKKTLLSKTVIKDLELNNIYELLKWAYNDSFFKNRVASVARTVCRTAEKGDIISKKILKEAAMEVVNSISTVAEKLNFKKRKFDLVFVGNVFKCEKFFKSIVVKSTINY